MIDVGRQHQSIHEPPTSFDLPGQCVTSGCDAPTTPGSDGWCAHHLAELRGASVPRT